MPTSRLTMENANGRWVVEFELGGLASQRKHFTGTDFLQLLDEIRNIYLNAGAALPASEAVPVSKHIPANALNLPQFPKTWTKAQREAHLRAHPIPGYVAPEEPADLIDASEGEIEEEDGDGEFDDGHELTEEEIAEQNERAIAAVNAAAAAKAGKATAATIDPELGITKPTTTPRVPRKPRQFAEPQVQGAPKVGK